MKKIEEFSRSPSWSTCKSINQKKIDPEKLHWFLKFWILKIKRLFLLFGQHRLDFFKVWNPKLIFNMEDYSRSRLIGREERKFFLKKKQKKPLKMVTSKAKQLICWSTGFMCDFIDLSNGHPPPRIPSSSNQTIDAYRRRVLQGKFYLCFPAEFSRPVHQVCIAMWQSIINVVWHLRLQRTRSESDFHWKSFASRLQTQSFFSSLPKSEADSCEARESMVVTLCVTISAVNWDFWCIQKDRLFTVLDFFGFLNSLEALSGTGQFSLDIHWAI